MERMGRGGGCWIMGARATGDDVVMLVVVVVLGSWSYCNDGMTWMRKDGLDYSTMNTDTPFGFSCEEMYVYAYAPLSECSKTPHVAMHGTRPYTSDTPR